MFSFNDIKNENFNDENRDPMLAHHRQNHLHHNSSCEHIYMKALQKFFADLDDASKRLSLYILSKSKIYACYKINAQKHVLRIVDNTKLAHSADMPVLYEKRIKNMKYMCDHAFGNHIAVSFEVIPQKKYLLQVYNTQLDLIASKCTSFQLNPVCMNEKELFCLCISAPGVHVFDMSLNETPLFFIDPSRASNPNLFECFKHRSFWICGATADFLYIDNRTLGFDIVCRRTGFVIKSILEHKRLKLPCARIDSQARIIMVDEAEKRAVVYDATNGCKLFENSLNNVTSNLEEHYLCSTSMDDFYLLKHCGDLTELNFFKTKSV